MDQSNLFDVEKILNEFCAECGKDRYKTCQTKTQFIVFDTMPDNWKRVKGACMAFERNKEPKKTNPTIKNNNQQSLF